jgi:hypothetical protein
MVVLGSLGFIIVMVNPFSEKYILSVRVDVITTHWNSIYQNGVMIVFLQNNNTVKECFVSCGHWENISISKGSYVLRVYEGKSGVFIKEYSIYIVKDTELNIKI